jgi:hypothetical protein
MHISGADIFRFIIAIGFLAYGYDQYFLFHHTNIALVCLAAILFIFPFTHWLLIEKPFNIHFSPNAKLLVVLVFIFIIGMLQKRH